MSKNDSRPATKTHDRFKIAPATILSLLAAAFTPTFSTAC